MEELSFNSFYEYSVQRIPDICEENRITGIDLSTYRYMMKDFYRSGNHEKTLNENMDSSLFDETFVVFEIDSIKDDPLLFRWLRSSSWTCSCKDAHQEEP